MRLRGQPLPQLDDVRAAPSPTEAVRVLATGMLRAAYGLESPPATESSRVDLRAYEQILRLLRELEGWRDLAGSISREDVLAALERMPVRLAGAAEPGRVAIIDLLRARTRRFEAVFVLGLEEGSLPRRATASPFLDDDARRDLDERTRARGGSGRTPWPGSASSLRGVHAAVPSPDARPRGGHRRRRPAAGEPVLARGARSLRPVRRGALDAGARSPRSRGLSRTRPRSGSVSARSPRWPPTTPPAPRPSPSRTAGNGASSGP